MRLSDRDMTLLLTRVPLFRGLTALQLQGLAAIGETRVLAAGEVLCRDGDASAGFYVLLAGTLRVHAGDVELGQVQAIDVVGEMGAMTGLPRCATVEARTDCRLLAVAGSQLEALLDGDDRLAARLYRNTIDSLCRKLRDTNVNLIRLQLHTS